MDKKLLDETHCPFNGMKPCIGRGCTMYLETWSITTSNGEKIDGNIFESKYPLPCALIFSGLKSAFDLLGLK